MRFSTLSALLVAAALAVAPQTVAFAKPAVTPSTLVTSTVVAPAASDADRYAAREAKDTAIAKFEGGREVLVIGGTTLVIVLLVVILVILL
jgi:hypothetical protein